MKHNLSSTILTSVLIFLTCSATITNAKDVGVESLSIEVREILTKEMLAIDSAMKEIVSANSSGDTEKVALIARQIKESFILKQGLTKHQKHELHSKLSSDFISQDKAFHYMAGMLEHAATNNKPELIGFYFLKLFEACSSCHQAYAKHRFTKFSNQSKVNEHTH